jgi:DnaJ-class molecular chaperone
MDNDLYHLLGLTHDATPEQIRVAYRKQAVRHHPDKGGDAEMFKKISNAYQILINPELRRKYDQSLPIPEIDLIPPLKVFAECFHTWLKQSPMMEFMFDDSCHEVLNMLNHNHDNPIIQMVINSLVGKQRVPVIEKHASVTLTELYHSTSHHYQFTLTNKDIGLGSACLIVDPVVSVDIPPDTDEIDVETEMYCLVPNTPSGYISKKIQVNVNINVTTEPFPNFYRIAEHDLLAHVDVNLEHLINGHIMTITHINQQKLHFYNPLNFNLHQIYKIENVALPNREKKVRGTLYIQFYLNIHKDQSSNVSVDPLVTPAHVYQLIPVNTSCLYQSVYDSNTHVCVPMKSVDLLTVHSC